MLDHFLELTLISANWSFVSLEKKINKNLNGNKGLKISIKHDNFMFFKLNMNTLVDCVEYQFNGMLDVFICYNPDTLFKATFIRKLGI